MYPAETAMNRRPRVTVAAVGQHDGRFLFVEERAADGRVVINQPAGHVEAGESIIDAAIREALEETGWHFRPDGLLATYLWQRDDRGVTYFRIALTGDFQPGPADAKLDPDILGTSWLTRDELIDRSAQHRSPLVLRCVDDFLAGTRYPLAVLQSLLA